MKLKFIFILLVMFFGNLSAQNRVLLTAKDSSGVTRMVLINNLGELIVEKDPALYSLNPANLYGGGIGSTDTSDVDTLSFIQDSTSATVYANIKITAIDSVLEVSFDNFTTSISVYKDDPLEIKNLSAVTFPKVFIRKKVATGTVNYRYYWYGY